MVFIHRGFFLSWNKARVFSSHCCCNAPLLLRWQGRVDCMLWYALSRNLWMCRSIIAILYLIGHFSLPHLAEVSSPRSVKSKVIEAICLCCPFFLDGHWIHFCRLSFLSSVWISGPLSGPIYVSKEIKKVSKPVIFTLHCCRSPLQRGSTMTLHPCTQTLV